jgi:rhamnose utilization protein RhaD (predicted bifunctional aldolase and dehydrogenase)
MLPREFIKTSASIGKDSMLVQGAGGNTSYKSENQMWIKASGKWLSNSEEEDIFVEVDLVKIHNNLKNNKSQPLKGSYIANKALRPSIETTLHALMPHKVVLHSHPINLLCMLILEDGESKLVKLLKDFNCTWVPYARPGQELTSKVQEATHLKHVDVLLLANHGLVVGAENSDQAFNLMNNILNCCELIPRQQQSPLNSLINKLAFQLDMRPPNNAAIHSLGLDEISYNYCNNKKSVMYPDQAVFLGPRLLCVNNLEELNNIQKNSNLFNNIEYVVVKNIGVLVSNNARKGTDEMLFCHAEVLRRISSDEKVNYLSENEVIRLLDWEPEKYRQSIR